MVNRTFSWLGLFVSIGLTSWLYVKDNAHWVEFLTSVMFFTVWKTCDLFPDIFNENGRAISLGFKKILLSAMFSLLYVIVIIMIQE